MNLDATPPIDPAIERELARVLSDTDGDARPSGYSVAWRRAALSEAVEPQADADEPISYAFSPRSTRGATRA